MRYEKPQVVSLPNAIDAVQMQHKTSDPAIDAGFSRKFTPSAYEADE